MELELNWEHTSHYKLLLETQVSQEETQETIVPDAYPDILRIVEAGGQLYLTEKLFQDGSLKASGVVDGWVLYQPENGGALCKLEAKLPFVTKVDIPGTASDGCCITRPVLCNIDARALNPRKVLIRADIGLGLCVYEPGTCSVCCDLELDVDFGVQKLASEEKGHFITAVKEKEFSVYEEVHAPAGLDATGELVCMRADVWCTEVKLIGTKLLFKGEAGVHLRYLTDGQLNSACVPISFSQVMELERTGEQDGCSVSLYATNLECVRAGEDGRLLNLTIDMVAQAVVEDQIPLVMLRDAYSTQGDLNIELHYCPVSNLLERYSKPQSMRELLETEVQAKHVVDASVRVCRTSVTGKMVETQLQAEVVYADEQNQVYHTGRTILMTAQLDLPENAQCRMTCQCPGEAFAAVTAGGIEVRFNLELRGCITREQSVLFVKKAHLVPSNPDSRGARPSVVMRTAMPGERLWDIAKAYRTTTQQLCQANDIEQESQLSGRMLLIPAGC